MKCNDHLQLIAYGSRILDDIFIVEGDGLDQLEIVPVDVGVLVLFLLSLLSFGLVLALFILFCFFELLAEVALAVAVHHGLVLIDTEFVGYFFFIDLIVGAEGEVYHALCDDRESQ